MNVDDAREVLQCAVGYSKREHIRISPRQSMPYERPTPEDVIAAIGAVDKHPAKDDITKIAAIRGGFSDERVQQKAQEFLRKHVPAKPETRQMTLRKD